VLGASPCALPGWARVGFTPRGGAGLSPFSSVGKLVLVPGLSCPYPWALPLTKPTRFDFYTCLCQALRSPLSLPGWGNRAFQDTRARRIHPPAWKPAPCPWRHVPFGIVHEPWEVFLSCFFVLAALSGSWYINRATNAVLPGDRGAWVNLWSAFAMRNRWRTVLRLPERAGAGLGLRQRYAAHGGTIGEM